MNFIVNVTDDATESTKCAQGSKEMKKNNFSGSVVSRMKDIAVK